MKLWMYGRRWVVNELMARARFEDVAGAAGAGNAGGNGAGGAGSPGAGGGAGEGPGAGGAAGGAGGAAADWRAGLDPEIKDHPCLKDFKSEKDAVKAYVGAQKLIGLDKLPMPPKDAKPEVREKFLNEVFDRLGRPKDAKEYKFTDVKLPEGVKVNVDPAQMDQVKAAFHKAGLLPAQADAMYQLYMTTIGGQVKQYYDAEAAKIKDVEAQLRTEWGAAFDAKKATAEKFLEKFASNEDRAHLIAKGINNDPVVIKLLANAGSAFSEDSLVVGEGEGTMTPKEALAAISEVDEKLMKMPRSHPEYPALLKRKTELYQMAYPA